MSGHLRHCPKHRKPLPCAHCALAAKSALVATGPLELSPEDRKKIEDSLATAPINAPEPTKLVEAETSRGTKTIDETADTDDAADAVDRTRTHGSGREHKKQPTHLKSVAHPVVPSADAQAPYGRDENDKTILPGRSDQQLGTGLLKRPDLRPGTCPHKSNPKYCLLCGTANNKAASIENNLQSPVRQRLIREQTKCGHGNLPADCPWCGVAEDQAVAALRRQFGIHTTLEKLFKDGETETAPMVFFPEILGIKRGQLVGLLELPAVTETRYERKKVLKDRVQFERMIAGALDRIPKRIEKYKRLIRCSEELIESLSVRVMKIRRAKEDILDKETREKYKHKERRRIERSNAKIAGLRKSLVRLGELKDRAATWGEHPDDYEIKLVSEQVEVKFWQKFNPPRNEDGKPDPNLTVGGYVALLDEYDLLKDVSRRLPKFPETDRWRYFENEIVLQAIEFGLLRPTDGALKKYGALTKYLDGDVDEPEQDDPERKLILKTGGSQIGGSIYSAGWRYSDGKAHQRPLESFDKHEPSDGPGEPPEYGGAPPGTWLSDLDSGDLEERAGDE